MAKNLVIDIRDPSLKSSYFTFSGKFIAKINKMDSMLLFSLKKKRQHYLHTVIDYRPKMLLGPTREYICNWNQIAEGCSFYFI